MSNLIDQRWVILEEGYPHTVCLTKSEADILVQKYRSILPHLDYNLFYDEYYEYSEIIAEN